jgi:LacI family kdg operon repressor
LLVRIHGERSVRMEMLLDPRLICRGSTASVEGHPQRALVRGIAEKISPAPTGRMSQI